MAVKFETTLKDFRQLADLPAGKLPAAEVVPATPNLNESFGPRLSQEITFHTITSKNITQELCSQVDRIASGLCVSSPADLKNAPQNNDTFYSTGQTNAEDIAELGRRMADKAAFVVAKNKDGVTTAYSQLYFEPGCNQDQKALIAGSPLLENFNGKFGIVYATAVAPDAPDVEVLRKEVGERGVAEMRQRNLAMLVVDIPVENGQVLQKDHDFYSALGFKPSGIRTSWDIGDGQMASAEHYVIMRPGTELKVDSGSGKYYAAPVE